MLLNIENPKDSIRKLLELVSNLAKFQDTKSIHRNHLHFYILTVKNQKEKLRNQSHSPLQKKKKRINYLEINLPKKMKEWFTVDYKTLMK